ncbi:hypothetical protein TNCV_1468871 [Trichonephila clavipes]|nr:hypothetical protein TNCV_1468871 [Trichonephila clavipes]
MWFPHFRHGQSAMKTNCYMNAELAHIHFIYGQAYGNGRVAVRLHQEKYPTSDEAHFWLNGYVNKQNCRIWSEANPQVYVETPLHPEKLTVWCALWAGRILLQKR